jgi:transcription initiation factor IIE alpha subunit
MQEAALEQRVHCRGCHETIQVVDKDASMVTAKRRIEDAMNEFQRTLRKLG